MSEFECLFQFNLPFVSWSGDNKCAYGFIKEHNLDIGDLLPQGLCVFAYQVIYPYYITLKNKGWFNWVRQGEGVIVQCPNPSGQVEMEVSLGDKKDRVQVEVIKTKGKCPKNYKKGDSFLLSNETFSFCPHALAAFVPYINLLSQGRDLPWKDDNDQWMIRCPEPGCGAKFSLAKG